MNEIEDREMEPRYLMQRIDSLEWLIGVMIGTMSEDQREYIEKRLAEHARNSEAQARRRDTDPDRDRAEIAYDLDEKIRNNVEDAAGGYAIMIDS